MSDRPSRRGPCSLEGCDRKKYSKGLCSGHYKRLKEFGTPTGGLPVGVRRKTRDPEYVVGEIEWLRGGGASPFEVCDALGFKPDTLERLLFRWNRHDLAAFVSEAA